MYLLQCLHCAHILICHQITFDERISLFFATPVDSVVAISEPVEKGCSLIVWNDFGKFLDIDLTDDICVMECSKN